MSLKQSAGLIQNQVSYSSLAYKSKEHLNPQGNFTFEAKFEDYFSFTSTPSNDLTSPYIDFSDSIHKPAYLENLDFGFFTDPDLSVVDAPSLIPRLSLFPSSKKISKIFTIHRCPHRNLNTTSHSSINTKKPTLKRHYWTTQEDKMVQTLVTQLGEKWNKIAEHLGNRTGKQVRDRYNNFLRRDIITTKFTDQEDALILSLLTKIGPKWTKIAEYMPGRTEYQVKNRYYGCLKKYAVEAEIASTKASETTAEMEDIEANTLTSYTNNSAIDAYQDWSCEEELIYMELKLVESLFE